LFLHRTSLPWTVLHLSFSQTTDGYKCGAGRLRWWSVFLHISCNFHWIPTNLPGKKKMMSFWVSSSNITDFLYV
jgi:hypothetical protein